MIKINRKLVTRIAVGAAIIMPFMACKTDKTTISTPPLQIGAKVADTTSGGTVKGTMVSGKTYHITRDIFVNKGDTLLLQSNVTLCMAPGTNIFVKGVFISNGSAASPNWIHPCGVTKMDDVNHSPDVDPCFSSTFTQRWGGINCDTSCKLLILKWTHIEFCGAPFNGTNATAITGIASGKNSYGVLFQNVAGSFDMEDCWLYGTVDDGMRIQRGKVNIMRNTFEKNGAQGGESVNMKGGTVGDVAFNLFVGSATNGSKLSNKNSPGVQSQVNMYNNTYINCGYRQATPYQRGGSIDYEGVSFGKCYNNLIVNSRVGLRVVLTSATGDGPADTTHMMYGNTYNYDDSLTATTGANMIYPVGDITHPQPTDIPDTSILFGHKHYNEGMVYNGAQALGKNNPMFANFSLPATVIKRNNFVGTYSFKLLSGSPAIGKGYTGFTPIGAVTVNANYGANEITLPMSDIGCYQSNGKGNQH